MSNGWRWRMIASYLILVAVVLASLYVYLRFAFRASLVAALRTELRRHAESMALRLGPSLEDSPHLQSLVEQWGQRTGLRVTVIGPEGELLADSERDPSAEETGIPGPEVRTARNSGWGFVERSGEDVAEPQLYGAVPLQGMDPPGLILRVARPFPEMAGGLQHLRAGIYIALGLLGLIGTGWVFLLAARISRPLEEISQSARRIAGGDLNSRVQIEGDPQINGLADSFNAMVDQLQDIISSISEEQARAETMLAQMAEGIIVTDPEGRIVRFNAAAERFFEVSSEKAWGETVATATLHHDLGEMVQRTLKQRLVTSGEIQVIQPRERFLEAYVAPLEAAPGVLWGSVTVLHDLTQLRHLENVRRDFVANVSHELRTPVASIRAMTEALLSGAHQDPELGPRFLTRIVQHTERLTLLLDDLLELASLESGQRELHRRPVDLREAAVQAIERLETRSQAKGQSICCEIPPGMIIQVDPEGMHQVLINLLDNAIKYTPEEGAIQISAQRNNGAVNIAVEDTGIGIPKRDLGRIFERFYRVDKTRSREMGGTGLGLSIVKHILEAHGGEVTVESELGRGSCFTVRFPTEEKRGIV